MSRLVVPRPMCPEVGKYLSGQLPPQLASFLRAEIPDDAPPAPTGLSSHLQLLHENVVLECSVQVEETSHDGGSLVECPAHIDENVANSNERGSLQNFSSVPTTTNSSSTCPRLGDGVGQPSPAHDHDSNDAIDVVPPCITVSDPTPHQYSKKVRAKSAVKTRFKSEGKADGKGKVISTAPRRSCKYGFECYNQSAEHHKIFAHPGDDDYIKEEDVAAAAAPSQLICIRGWLLAKTTEAAEHRLDTKETPARRVSSSSLIQKVFSSPFLRPARGDSQWERQYFMLGPDGLVYWPPSTDASSGAPVAGSFAFTELDAVSSQDGELTLNFKKKEPVGTARRLASVSLREIPDSDSISINLSMFEEAVRSAMIAKLGAVLPSGWNLGAVVNDGRFNGRFVNKEPLSGSITFVIQRLLDHTQLDIETRDRLTDDGVPLRFEVLSVLKVENSPAWFSYEKARVAIHSSKVERFMPSALTSTLSDSVDELGQLSAGINEHWLFHGTTVSGAQGISDGEFRLDLAGTHRGTLYGNGVYLAESSTKADEYAEADTDDVCRMLLCRAVLGNVLTNAERFPNKEELEARCKNSDFHSVCGDRKAARGTFREFVFYDSNQVYPAYIIHYRRVPESELLQRMKDPPVNPEAALHYIAHAARLAEVHPDISVQYRIKLLLGMHVGNSIPQLLACLKDKRPGVRRHAADTLGRLTSFPVQSSDSMTVAVAVPELNRCLKDEDLNVRVAVGMALEKIGKYL